MAQPLQATMPSSLDLGENYTLRVTALDATTGAVVAGVKIDAVTLTATVVAGAATELQTGGWKLVPGPGG